MAVLGVLAYHAGLPLPGGFLGVDVFFVVSGFVITGLLTREQEVTGRLDLRGFYLRRLRRLAPALALVSTITLALSATVLSPVGAQQVAARTAAAAQLLVANLAIARSSGGYFDSSAAINPYLHTWSLSVEEQFYLVFPLLLMLGWKVG
ncbi:MAG TPA: acyltransferase, partial [Dehalococcoidia bacterium]|nr:acyltransferase [Dehalococcoidia bacterium]